MTLVTLEIVLTSDSSDSSDSSDRSDISDSRDSWDSSCRCHSGMIFFCPTHIFVQEFLFFTPKIFPKKNYLTKLNKKKSFLQHQIST